MSFEIREKDLLARIGRLKTKSGTVETPLLFPVINPMIQPISPRRIKEDFGFEAVITNAYILRKHRLKQPLRDGLRSFLDFNGPVMTDSGAYQILVYGDVEVAPKEIISYQEYIGSDIATILDIPTGWKVTPEHAEHTVEETLRRAKELFAVKEREDILWVGPVQGGKYLNLVRKSALEIGKLPFQIHALGSPTEVMERYCFDVLVNMIMTAKMNLPIDRPLHLFGAGHPFMFAFAVALGCDLFDSAAYSLYAKEGRYMTETGTSRLNELDYFPCSCPKCARTTPENVMKLSPENKQLFLAEHNLHACAAELRRIKQAIKDGRMWEHLEIRAHSHPALLKAMQELKSYTEHLEKYDSATKKSGLFFFNALDLSRPEITRYRRKLLSRYAPPEGTEILLLLPQTRRKPFHKSAIVSDISNQISHKEDSSKIHICFYSVPFGVVPEELDEVYPLSQHVAEEAFDRETLEHIARNVSSYIENTTYKSVLLLNDAENWGTTILKTCRKTCIKKKIMFRSINKGKDQRNHLLAELKKALAN
jgi:7-cyano-7-deazaguanine tRNA-ribosyltransferase